MKMCSIPAAIFISVLCLVIASESENEEEAPDLRSGLAAAAADCYDAQRNVSAAEGQWAPLGGGRCGRLLCEGGARPPRFVKQECEPVPDKSCRVEPGVPDAPFPSCCNQIMCGGLLLQHGKCVNPATNTVHQKGATWPLPDGECGYMECKGYTYDVVNKRPSWRFLKRSCAQRRAARPLCTLEPGLAGAHFPACCPREMCIVSSRSLDNASEEDDDRADEEDSPASPAP